MRDMLGRPEFDQMISTLKEVDGSVRAQDDGWLTAVAMLTSQPRGTHVVIRSVDDLHDFISHAEDVMELRPSPFLAVLTAPMDFPSPPVLKRSAISAPDPDRLLLNVLVNALCAAPPSAAVDRGRGPLHLSCAVGSLDVTLKLVLAGWDPACPTHVSGATPLLNAIVNGHADVFECLLTAPAASPQQWTRTEAEATDEARREGGQPVGGAAAGLLDSLRTVLPAVAEAGGKCASGLEEVMLARLLHLGCDVATPNQANG